MPSGSTHCPRSTLPQTNTHTKMPATGQTSIPERVSQELCYLTSACNKSGGGKKKEGERAPAHQCTDRARIPASRSTMLELSRSSYIPAWHKRPVLSGYSEPTAPQKFRLRERHISHLVNFLPEKQPCVDNTARDTLGISFREFTGAPEKTAL